jgi:hypothetical protein
VSHIINSHEPEVQGKAESQAVPDIRKVVPASGDGGGRALRMEPGRR